MKNLNESMEVLSRTIDKLTDGTASPSVANAINNCVRTMISGAKLQMEYMNVVGDKPSSQFLQIKDATPPTTPSKKAA